MYGRNQYGFAQYGHVGHISQAYTQSFDETITISDDPVETVLITFTKLLNDTITMVDEVFRLDIRIFFDEIVMSVDDIIRDTVKQLSDTSTITDTISRSVTKIYTDISSILEDFFKGKAIENTDQIDITDTYSRVVSFNKTYDDTVTPTDTISSIKGKSFNDTLTLSDVFRKFYNGLSTTWVKMEKSVTSLWHKQHKP